MKRLITKKNITILSLIILGIAFGLPLFLVKYLKVDFNDLGTYGDFFGCFNSMVSALAFGGLIYTIILQRQDLKLQRDELKLTREELKRQAEAQEAAANEQANQVSLLKEQLYKEVRPYINAYLTDEGHSVYLIVKNIGKSACNNFSIKVDSYSAEDEKAKNLLENVKKVLDSVEFSLIPSGLDNVISLDISSDDVVDYLFLSSIDLVFSFYFQGKKEVFSTTFKFNETQSHGDPMVRALYTIANRISSSRPY